MAEQNFSQDEQENCERPLECSACKRPIAILYTEIVRNQKTCTGMCKDCPELEKRLFGSLKENEGHDHFKNSELVCGNCGTTLQDVRRGHRLGCQECYTVFENVIVLELQNTQRLPPKLVSLKKSASIHVGKIQGKGSSVNPSSKLLALNEALNDTLKREDYEQAAILRDQIKAIENSQTRDSSDEPASST